MSDKKQGRPTKYKEEYDSQAYKLAKSGMTDIQMSEFFEVAESTFHLWKKEYPIFSESIKRGKCEFDNNEVEKTLLQRALGYTYEKENFEEKEEEKVLPDGKTELKKMKKHFKCTEHVAADVGAMIWWLKNRTQGKWSNNGSQDFVNIDLTGCSTYTEKTNKILSAVAQGLIPVDKASGLISAISNTVKIDEYTAMEERLKALEAAQNEQE